jgi:flagellar motility protein MotE (MotC chaperone)
MIRYIRDLRLIPIALIASACLLALKVADIVLDSGYFFRADNAPAQETATSVIRAMPDSQQSSLSWAQQMFNFPNRSGATPAPSAVAAIAPSMAERAYSDITGSVTTDAAKDGTKDSAKDAGKDDAKSGDKSALATPGKDKKSAPPPNGVVIPTNGPTLPTGAERAILERLQERREELDTRARELDIRENLIKGAEKRIEARLNELKEVEGRITTDTQKKNDAEAAKLKGLVIMYENMKPRDAAKIFDRLELGVLLQVASLINPRQMAEILAQMSPDTAERLTVELASKANDGNPGKDGSPNDLPKIMGQPTTP